MNTWNKIQVAGFTGRDPELRYTPAGDAVCNFSIASTEKRRDGDVTTWFNVTAWRKTAEVISEHVKKGDPIFIEGRLTEREYKDRDGNTRKSLEITVTEFHFLAQREQAAAATGSGSNAPATDDDIPF